MNVGGEQNRPVPIIVTIHPGELVGVASKRGCEKEGEIIDDFEDDDDDDDDD